MMNAAALYIKEIHSRTDIAIREISLDALHFHNGLQNLNKLEIPLDTAANRARPINDSQFSQEKMIEMAGYRQRTDIRCAYCCLWLYATFWQCFGNVY